jgi:hypothetical protein
VTKPPRWDRDEWEEASYALWRRCGDLCELCGKRLQNRAERHHRQRRRTGGDRLSNLLLVHPECHTRIHSQPEWSRANGYIVSAYATDPAGVPVAIRNAKWLLADDGTKHPIE